MKRPVEPIEIYCPNCGMNMMCIDEHSEIIGAEPEQTKVRVISSLELPAELNEEIYSYIDITEARRLNDMDALDIFDNSEEATNAIYKAMILNETDEKIEKTSLLEKSSSFLQLSLLLKGVLGRETFTILKLLR